MLLYKCIVFELPEQRRELNPTPFSQPPNTPSNYVLGVIYILYT